MLSTNPLLILLWLLKRWLHPSPDKPRGRLSVLSALQDSFFAKLHRSRSFSDLPSLRLRPKAVLEFYVSVGGLPGVTWLQGLVHVCSGMSPVLPSSLSCSLGNDYNCPVPWLGRLVLHATWLERPFVLPAALFLCCVFSLWWQRYPR